MSDNHSILLVGKPQSTKTTFLAKLYIHARQNKGIVRLTGAPENIKIIEDAVNRLYEGNETVTTPENKHGTLVLPLSLRDNTAITLHCPEYGGEQVDDMIRLREINSDWKTRIEGSNKWVLFIRPSTIIKPFDLATKSADENNGKGKAEDDSALPGAEDLSEQAQFIELLQFMLHIKGRGVQSKIHDLTLTIVLTCWDELNVDKKPNEVLEGELPLLASFIKAVWLDSKTRVLGLSAQEFRLNSPEAKELYLSQLPENFGYIIDEDGARNKDITALIQAVL